MLYRKIIISFILIYSIHPAKVLAQTEFNTAFKATYTISPQGMANVDLEVSLTNNLADTFAREYRLTFGSNRLKNLTAEQRDGSQLPINYSTFGNQSVVDLTFNQPVVGKGKTQVFTLSYDDPDITQNIGNVLEIMIPKLETGHNVGNYYVTLLVPLEFGAPAIVSPPGYAVSTDPVYTKLVFNSEGLVNSAITAIFGDHQIYAYTLTYHLDNTTVTPLETQIALPPDTAYQKMFFDKITPPPLAIHPDNDGNWIADYTLNPQQSFDVQVVGKVTTYLKPTIQVPSEVDHLKDYLTEQKYWPVSDSAIQTLSQKYQTPAAIYQYLVDTFSYDYQRIDNRTTSRLGAKTALENPQHNLCLEFTDAFISLSRAAGIPARLLTGFAYTENERLRPLSLVQDVLHAWPEYYDFATQNWHPVDPTWGNTTGGIDYFHQLDFNHVVFAIQGTYPDRPFPVGYYKVGTSESKKDIDITFSRSIPLPNVNFQPQLVIPQLTRWGLTANFGLSLTNRSNQAFYNEPIALFASGPYSLMGPTTIPTLLPYQTVNLPVKFKPLLATLPLSISLRLHGINQTLTLSRYSLGNSQTLTLIAAALGLAGLVIVGAFISRRLLVSRSAKTRSLHR